jgi:hypothetical protein
MKTPNGYVRFMFVIVFNTKKAVGRTARSLSHTSERGVLFEQSRSQRRPMVSAFEANAGNAHAATTGFRHLQMLRA